MALEQSRTLPALVVTAIVSVVFGVGLGFLVGQRNSAEPPGAGVETSTEVVVNGKRIVLGGSGVSIGVAAAETVDPGTAAFDDEAARELTALRVQLAQEKGEAARLREQVAALEAEIGGDEVVDHEKRLAFAREMFDGIVAIETGAASPEDMVKLAGRLDELDEDLVDYFAGRYREALADEKDDRRETAVMLAMISGGEKAAGFLDGILNDGEIDPEERADVLRDVGHWGSWVSMERIPLTDSLRRTSERLRQSDLDWERAGGVSLLAGSDAPETRAILEGMLMQDPNDRVKASAVRSLALSGDRSTRTFLQDYYDTATASGRLADSRDLRRSLERALEYLAEQFPD